MQMLGGRGGADALPPGPPAGDESGFSKSDDRGDSGNGGGARSNERPKVPEVAEEFDDDIPF